MDIVRVVMFWVFYVLVPSGLVVFAVVKIIRAIRQSESDQFQKDWESQVDGSLKE